ncbi:hypothetical protein SLEP1_g27736 [Rubroshorea leprosula]|uniref:Secreted protein n=1 Tax=Rubroshorea leprosula TaxID=152421 RepID=A0AAV5K248_9ROSI|nr:hypothetical protein SLEP1_g27736 [Rubroshorea leprosula]
MLFPLLFAGCSCLWGRIALVFARELPPQIAAGSSPTCSPIFGWKLWFLILGGALVRELSVRFYASEVSKLW